MDTTTTLKSYDGGCPDCHDAIEECDWRVREGTARMLVEVRATVARWHPDYLPTIIIEQRAGVAHAHSCRTVAEAKAVRAECVASGRGYFDGTRTIGRAV